MRYMKFLSCVFLGALLLPLLAGCGSGGGANFSGTGGRLALKITWPQPTRGIPVMAKSIKIALSDGGNYSASQTVDRPAGGGSSTLAFTSVPVGSLNVTATSYPQTGGQGVMLSIGQTTVTVVSDQTTNAAINMVSTVDHVDITKSASTTLTVQDTLQLTATAKDASGAVIPVAPNGIAWISMNPAAATVDANGLVTAVLEGSAVIKAVERESGVYGTVTVTVNGTGAGGVSVTLSNPAVSVAITPATATISPYLASPFPFAATVSGSQNNMVTWQLDEAGGGTIDMDGRYLPPTTTGTYHVRATSVADPTKSAVAIVTVSTAPQIVAVSAMDILPDPQGRYIYACVASSDIRYPNAAVKIDPYSNSVVDNVFVGSNPTKLALSDDGQYLYVAIDNAVVCVDTASFTVRKTFALGSDSSMGPFYAEDMAVIPGDPLLLAVSRKVIGFSPRHGGVAIYEDGVMRATTTPGHTGSNVIESTENAALLYGYNNESTEYGLRTMAVNASGVTVTKTAQSLLSGFSLDIDYHHGLLYATSGRVVNPQTSTLVGTYAATGPVCPDFDNQRVYFLSSTAIKAFNMSTFAPAGSYTMSTVSNPAALIRWGTSGLAFCDKQNKVMLLYTEAIK